ncbi:MAG: hypothetical protein Q9164_001969 [Protoblastenia rupestris]
MALVKTAAAIAGSTAAAAYVDAKYHISKDIGTLKYLSGGDREFKRNASKKRASCFYFFEESLAKYPHHRAIWSREGSYTLKETHEKAFQYAAFFLEQGVGPGQLVAFYLQNQPEFIFAWLGLWAIGCAPAMINFNLAGDALVHCVQISGAKVMLVDQDEKCSRRINAERDRIESGLGIECIVLSPALKTEIGLKSIQRLDDSFRDGVTGDFPIALFYTSGTTGLPKAATYTTARLHATAATRGALCSQTRGPNGDCWYNCMPLYHGTGGQSALSNLMNGVTLAIGKGFSVRNFWKDVKDSEATFIVYVGETARYLLAAPPGPFDRAHKVRCMYGNGLRPDVWLRFRERFGVEEVAEFFNSSEGMLSLFIWDRGDYFANCVGHHGALMRAFVKNVYAPVPVDPDTNEMIRDPSTGFVKRNTYEEGGEIIVRVAAEADFAGYHNNKAATRKKLVRDVFQKYDMWYRSGDALRRAPDGRWFFIDRLGDTYRWKSETVSTAEVAQVIGLFPGVQEANVYGVQVPGHEGRAGCAALSIAPEQRAGFDFGGLARWAEERLQRYSVPVFLRVLGAGVGERGSHNNKQDKVGLRAEGLDPGLRGSKVKGGEMDQLFWLKPNVYVGSQEYTRFEDGDWRNLVGGTARL